MPLYRCFAMLEAFLLPSSRGDVPLLHEHLIEHLIELLPWSPLPRG
ncbi:hypothetical protein [Streptomyces goshikiensis]